MKSHLHQVGCHHRNSDEGESKHQPRDPLPQERPTIMTRMREAGPSLCNSRFNSKRLRHINKHISERV